MRNLQYHIVYLIGIGGIGMSALARWFHHQGYQVCGYDRTATPLTDRLQEEGIIVHFEDSVKKIPEKVVANCKDTLIIYTPAIPKDHQGFNYLQSKGYTIKKRSQVLGLLTENRFTVAVAGTHGKTTTSTLIAHILHFSGKNCDAFLGGISNNLNSNLLIGDKIKEEAIMVVEADEYDRSFLTLQPNIAVVTSTDADHLDIYGDKESLKNSFSEFLGQCVLHGTIIIKTGLETVIPSERKDLKVLTYGLQEGEVQATNITIENAAFQFDYCSKNTTIEKIKLNVPGFHNVENALAACTVALSLGLDKDKIRDAIENFKGVKRRFEYVIKNDKTVYIDDYAHHPVEIEAFLTSVKALYPDKPLTVIFQPHLFTRTRDFMQEFGESLGLADEIWLMDIYPARELPIPGITSELLLTHINSQKKQIVDQEEVLRLVRDKRPRLVVTIGAGDIDKLVKPIGEILMGVI